MSQESAVAFAVQVTRYDGDPHVTVLLRAIAEAWVRAEELGFISESEANRWSPVCEAAAKVVA